LLDKRSGNRLIGLLIYQEIIEINTIRKYWFVVVVVVGRIHLWLFTTGKDGMGKARCSNTLVRISASGRHKCKIQMT
jgi:hypothetical protein